MGLGQLGLTPSSLYDLTFREFSNAMAGRHHEIEMRERSEWERTRWLACLLLNPHTKKRLKPTDLATFEWEKKAKTAVDGSAILRQIAGHGKIR
jgi:hypothetical protein